MTALRLHGEPSYNVAVIHGGPGAPGSVAHMAAVLSRRFGVLEPFQTAASVMGQVEELRDGLLQSACPPVVLIGHSWGLGYRLSWPRNIPTLCES